jgi:enamidase
MEASHTSSPAGKLVIRNIGLVLSGDIVQPVHDADTIVVVDGRITGYGWHGEVDTDAAEVIIDAKGTTVAPGLIDSHVHPVFGDWTPRQQQSNWIDSCLHGGVSTMISAGEVHVPGRPTDVVGVKALAIAAQRTFSRFRPSGVKVQAGAPILEQGMEEQDFADLAAAGVTLLGEIGLGSVKAAAEVKRLVAWARAHGLQSTIHTGGPSIPGSGLIDKDVVLAADTDVIGHINGGHTALPQAHIRELCARSHRAIEIVHNGNLTAALVALRTLQELGQLHRVILGTDAPAGSGVQPLGLLRLLAMLCSLGDIPAPQAVCFATGNTATQRGLESGLIAVGRPADIVLLDRPQHSAGRTVLDSLALGDIPGIGMVIIDGTIRLHGSRNTPPPAAMPEIIAGTSRCV